MDEQPKSFQLSPGPDPHHHHRVLLYGIGAVLLIFIAGSVGYLLAVTRSTPSMKDITQTKSQTIMKKPLITPTPRSTQDFHLPISITGEVKIMNGSLYSISASGSTTLVIDASTLPNTYGYGNIRNFTFSPDKSKIFILVDGVLTEPLLFYTPVNNVNPISLNVANEAVWSHNSRYIAFSFKPADAGPISQLAVYDTIANKRFSLPIGFNFKNFKYATFDYSNLQWNNDDSGIQVHYLAQQGDPNGPLVGEGNVVILLTSFLSEK